MDCKDYHMILSEPLKNLPSHHAKTWGNFVTFVDVRKLLSSYHTSTETTCTISIVLYKMLKSPERIEHLKEVFVDHLWFARSLDQEFVHMAMGS